MLLEEPFPREGGKGGSCGFCATQTVWLYRPKLVLLRDDFRNQNFSRGPPLCNLNPVKGRYIYLRYRLAGCGHPAICLPVV